MALNRTEIIEYLQNIETMDGKQASYFPILKPYIEKASEFSKLTDDELRAKMLEVYGALRKNFTAFEDFKEAHRSFVIDIAEFVLPQTPEAAAPAPAEAAPAKAQKAGDETQPTTDEVGVEEPQTDIATILTDGKPNDRDALEIMERKIQDSDPNFKLGLKDGAKFSFNKKESDALITADASGDANKMKEAVIAAAGSKASPVNKIDQEYLSKARGLIQELKKSGDGEHDKVVQLMDALQHLGVQSKAFAKAVSENREVDFVTKKGAEHFENLLNKFASDDLISLREAKILEADISRNLMQPGLTKPKTQVAKTAAD
jgi:hypothetical protein